MARLIRWNAVLKNQISSCQLVFIMYGIKCVTVKSVLVEALILFLVLVYGRKCVPCHFYVIIWLKIEIFFLLLIVVVNLLISRLQYHLDKLTHLGFSASGWYKQNFFTNILWSSFWFGFCIAKVILVFLVSFLKVRHPYLKTDR